MNHIILYLVLIVEWIAVHGYGAAQTKDFSLQVSFYFFNSKTASEAKENPGFLFSLRRLFLQYTSQISSLISHATLGLLCVWCVCVCVESA